MFWVILAKHLLLCQQGHTNKTCIADSYPCRVSIFSQSFLTLAWVHCTDPLLGVCVHTLHCLRGPLRGRQSYQTYCNTFACQEIVSLVLCVVNNGAMSDTSCASHTSCQFGHKHTHATIDTYTSILLPALKTYITCTVRIYCTSDVRQQECTLSIVVNIGSFLDHSQ